MDEDHWQGELWLARDFCLLLGANGDTRAHAHYAHQAVLNPERPLRMTLGGTAVSGHVLLIESGQRHAFDEAGQPMLAVYAEPLAFSLDTLRAVLADIDTVSAANLPAVAALMQAAPRQPLDPRIATALRALDASLEEKISATDLARQASLSLSQLERLFGQQVLLSVRRLVLWRRLRLALSLAMGGESLTVAAHAAGFADAAHFSRTVRSTFGVRADQTLAHLRLRVLD